MIWFERKFDFNIPAELYPMLMERLRGTPARLEERLRRVKPEIATMHDGDGWSIQEHVGHVLDLEPLWEGRIDDFIEGMDRLRPADLENRKTHEANHNASTPEKLLKDFRIAREHLVGRFEGFQGEEIVMAALHPRLDQEMRVIDSAFFVAEHDDHHLAHITRLIRKFR